MQFIFVSCKFFVKYCLRYSNDVLLWNFHHEISYNFFTIKLFMYKSCEFIFFFTNYISLLCFVRKIYKFCHNIYIIVITFDFFTIVIIVKKICNILKKIVCIFFAKLI